MPTVTSRKITRHHVISLRRDGWQRQCDRLGLVTDKQKAEALGMSLRAVNQMQNGRVSPSVPMIASALVVFAPAHFEDVFYVRTLPVGRP